MGDGKNVLSRYLTRFELFNTFGGEETGKLLRVLNGKRMNVPKPDSVESEHLAKELGPELARKFCLEYSETVVMLPLRPLFRPPEISSLTRPGHVDARNRKAARERRIRIFISILTALFSGAIALRH